MSKRYVYDTLLTESIWIRAFGLLRRLSFPAKLVLTVGLWLLIYMLVLWVVL